MKIGIIGIGSVGAAVATAVHNTGLFSEMILIERDSMRSRAAAEDLGHAGAFGFDVNVKDGRYTDLKDAEVVVICAGANQKEGQTRTDLLNANAAVIDDIVPRIMNVVDKNKIKIVMVTNPLDVMVMHATKISGLPPHRVVGTGTMLDSARLKVLLSRKLNVSKDSISCFVLGEHGDSSVLNWSAVRVGGISLNDFCRQTKNILTARARDTVAYRVRAAAYEIIKGRGATWDGIAAAVADLVRVIVRDEKRILSVSSVVKDVAVSLPRIVGKDGILMTLSPSLNAREAADLRTSSGIVKKNFKMIK